MKQLKRLVIFATLLLVSSPAFTGSSKSSKVKDGWSEAYGDVIKIPRVVCSKNLVLNGSRKGEVNFSNTGPQVIYPDCEKWTASMTYKVKKEARVAN